MKARLVLFFIIMGAFLVPTAHNIWYQRKTLSSQQMADLLPPAPLRLAGKSGDPCQNIYKLVCQKKGTTHDPTGSVQPDIDGERQALNLYKEIIQKYSRTPASDIDTITEQLVEQIFTPKRRGRILTAYQWVRRSIEKFILKQPATVFTSDEKKQILSRIRKTVLELPPPASIYADEPDLFTKNEVYYERTASGKMRLRVGGAYVFIAKSWFNLVFTLAHELAHSIDPCEMRAARLAFPAYDRLTACFLDNKLIAVHKTRSECGENDQLSETFADWIAVNITADALSQFSTEFHPQQIVNAARNSVRDLCEQEDEDPFDLDTDFHPSPKVRIEKIFGSHPSLRELLGCSQLREQYPHCGFEVEITDRLNSVPDAGGNI